MIHHLSIAAREPARVAGVIAEMIGGKAFPFPPVEGGFVAICDDGHATLVEVYPQGTAMVPGMEELDVQFAYDAAPTGYTPTHAAISVAIDETQIKAIAQREGWRAVTCDRAGLFQVVEVWLENTQLLELLTPPMARAYLDSVNSENWERFVAGGG